MGLSANVEWGSREGKREGEGEGEGEGEEKKRDFPVVHNTLQRP
jgi:hypothetical protein